MITLIALAPLASAGPGASVGTLESSAECEESYESHGDQWGSNGSWYAYYYSAWTRECVERFDYATAEAHDDDGTLVGATVGGEQGNESSSSWGWSDAGWPGSSYHSDASSWSSSSWWSRGAAVETRAGSVEAADGCTNAYSSGGWDATSYQPDYSSSAGGGSSSDANRCGAGASSSAGGMPVDAWAGEDCGSSSEWNEYQSSDPYSSYSFANEASSSSCGRGASADAAGQSTSAAAGGACQAFSEDRAFTNGNQTSTHSFDTSRCRSGVFASGPDGIGLFAGHDAASASWCDGESCSDSAWSSVGLGLDWAHSPLGPNGLGLWYTLP